MPRRVNHAVIGSAARHRRSEDRGNAWKTPAWLVAEIRRAFGGVIHLDPATEPDNPTGARRFFTADDDGLGRGWVGNVFCNPPYSPLKPWVDKAIAEAARGARIYMLLPVRTDAEYHQRLLEAATDVVFLRRRLKFVRADGGGPSGNAAFGSMIVGIGVSVAPLAHLGRILVNPDEGEAA